MIESNEIYCGDCIELMKEIPDKSIDLVLTDPPYGITKEKWDIIPSKEYFDEIFRISKNQCIFGANYFQLSHTESWVCWDKTYAYNQKLDIGEFELIWTSFNHKAKFLRYTCCGNFRGFKNPHAHYDKLPNQHPTEKPIEVMLWFLNEYSNENALILDPFLGSGTTAVACLKTDRNFIGMEILPEYCAIAQKRIDAELAQLKLEI